MGFETFLFMKLKPENLKSDASICTQFAFASLKIESYTIV